MRSEAFAIFEFSNEIFGTKLSKFVTKIVYYTEQFVILIITYKTIFATLIIDM